MKIDGLNVVLHNGPKVSIRTEDDVREYFALLAGAKQIAIANHAQRTARIVATLIRALEQDVDRLSPETNDAIADAARAMRAIEADMQTLVARRPTPRVTS